MTVKPSRRFKTLAAVALTIATVGACSTTNTPVPTTASVGTPVAGASAASTAATHKPVTISVGVLRPGATQEATDALNLQISEFEAKYPWVTVEPQEYNWTASTFTAALAAGTLPDVFTIPFTDGKGLIAQHQIVNIDARVRALPYVDKFNKSILANGQDDKGQIWAVPYQAYGMSSRTTGPCSRRPVSIPTSRLRPGTKSRPTQRSSPTRPIWPASPRWLLRTPAAGS